MHTANVTCHVPVAFHQPILDHYHLVAPLLETLFGGAPLVYAAYPRGLGNYATFHGALHSVAPGHLPTIDVAGPRGLRDVCRVHHPRPELGARPHVGG